MQTLFVMTTAMKMKKETGARNCYIVFLFIIIMINTTATQECMSMMVMIIVIFFVLYFDPCTK